MAWPLFGWHGCATARMLRSSMSGSSFPILTAGFSSFGMFMMSDSTRIFLMTVVLLASPSVQFTTVAEPIPKESRTVSATTPATGVWRRTSQGWQRTNDWPTEAERSHVRGGKVHPVVLATLIGLISLGGLIGFGPPRRKTR